MSEPVRQPPVRPRERGARPAVVIAIVVGVLLAVVGLAAGPAIRIRVAHARAERLCAAAVVGGPVAGLEERGRQLGLRMSDSRAIDERPGMLMGVDGFVFSRWICTIRHADGRVVSKDVSSLD
jgi:hypothetical protein